MYSRAVPTKIGALWIDVKVETKMIVFTFSQKFIFAFRENLLTIIDEIYENIREILQ
jgi:hypothetical protein